MWFSYRPVQNGMAMVWHMHTFAGESRVKKETTENFYKQKSIKATIELLWFPS